MSEPETARPTRGGRGRTHSSGRPGRWGPEPGGSNQFERLWSRPSESPIDFAKRSSLHNLRPWSSLSHSRYHSVDPKNCWLVAAGWVLEPWLLCALLRSVTNDCTVHETQIHSTCAIEETPETTLLRFGTDNFEDHEIMLSRSGAGQLRNTRREQEKSAQMTRRYCARDF